MMLLLTVVSPHCSTLGDRARHVFGPAGGMIGRSAECDWVLPDEKHHLSARHARIENNGLGFTITDTSTNGVFLNRRDMPLGRHQTAPLIHGDTLYLADYVIEATVTDQKAMVPVPVPRTDRPFGLVSTTTPVASSATRETCPEAKAFWDELGVAAARLPTEARERLLRALGAAVREAASALATLDQMPDPAIVPGIGIGTQGAPTEASAVGLPAEAGSAIDLTIRHFVQTEIMPAGARAQ